MPGPVVAKASRTRVQWAYGGAASNARRELAPSGSEDLAASTWAWGSMTHEALTFSHDWLTPVLARLEQLARLPIGWDGDGGVPASAVSILETIRSLHSLGPAPFRLPAIVSGPSGAIAVEWHVGGVDAELDIPSGDDEGDVEVYISYLGSDDAPAIGPLRECVDHLRVALTWAQREHEELGSGPSEIEAELRALTESAS